MTLMSQPSIINNEIVAPSPGASILTYRCRIHLHLPQDGLGLHPNKFSTHLKSIAGGHQFLTGSSLHLKSFALLPVTAPGTVF